MMKNKKSGSGLAITIGIIVLIVTVAIFSFTLFKKKSHVTEKELYAYVKNPDNGLMKEQTKDDVKFVVYYKPSDLLVAQDKNSKQAQQPPSDVKMAYSDYYYFVINLSKDNQELEATLLTTTDFGKAIQELAFGMNKHISIITSEQDTIELATYLFPRMYGSTGSTSFICAFEKKDIEKSKNFDLVFYHPLIVESPVRFNYITQDIENTPGIKF